jgi:hypothetical protein
LPSTASRRLAGLACALLLLMASAGCGARHATLAAPAPAAGTPTHSGPGGALGGLPGLAALPAPDRATAAAGPGWYSLGVGNAVASANATLPSGTALGQFSTPQLGYAVFGLYGFSSGAGPTSAKVDVSGISGSYFVGFSDYKSGRWNFAGPFTDDATLQIPDTGSYRTPADYVTDYAVSYVVFAVPAGSALTLESLQVGIAPGPARLRPPGNGGVQGGDAGTKVVWLPSPDDGAPDFAGYVVERAPQTSGDFTRLTPQPQAATSYYDATATPGLSYRWRVAAADTGGGLSNWMPFTGGGIAGNHTGPVIKLSYPSGRIYGPATVHFDLSGSFSPDGDTIAEYDIATPTNVVTSATPDVAVPLNPGGYRLAARVKTATDTAIQYFNLEVYPKWGAAPEVVQEPLLNAPGSTTTRLYFARTARLPDGRLLACGLDLLNGSILFRQEQADGSFSFTTFPVYDGFNSLTKLVEANGIYYLGFAGGYSYSYIAWDPAADGGRGAGTQQSIYSTSGNSIPFPQLALAASPAGRVWAVYMEKVSSDNTLQCKELTAPGLYPDTVDTGFASMGCLDAACHAADNTVDIAYSIGAGLQFVRWDTATSSSVASSSVDPTTPATLDIEEDPSSGEPGFLYYLSGIHRWLFSQRDSGGTLSAPYQVQTTDSGEGGRLVYTASKTYAAVADGSAGTYALYELGASSATARNTAASLNWAGILDLAAYDGEQLLGLGNTTAGQIELRRLDPGGTDTLLQSFDATDGQGYDLEAASGTDGVHAVFVSLYTGTTCHVRLSGGTWDHLASIAGASDPSIAATDAGEVHISYSSSSAGMHRLRRWDPVGGNLVDCGQDEAGDSMNDTILGGNPGSDEVYWLHWDDGASKFQVTHGNSGGYSTYTETVSFTPLWDGAVVAPDPVSDWTAVFNGGGLAGRPDSGYVCWQEASNNKPLFSPPTHVPVEMLTNVYVRGRGFAAEPAMGPGPFGAGSVYYIAMGPDYAPVRYTYALGSESQVTDIALPTDATAYLNHELRRTVTADCTPDSLTPVALIMSLDGADKYMEWGVNGDFRRLQLPPGFQDAKQVCRGAIVIGGDGLWHILYQDRMTDRIMCWSSVAP